MVFVTHDQIEAMTLADRIVVHGWSNRKGIRYDQLIAGVRVVDVIRWLAEQSTVVQSQMASANLLQ